MGIRYKSRSKKRISRERHKQYRKKLEDRDREKITIYKTPQLNHPSPAQITGLDLVGHTWAVGDRMSKLAHKHYGDPKLWWIIGWFNQKPTDNHIDLGDTVQIPFPVEKVLSHLGV